MSGSSPSGSPTVPSALYVPLSADRHRAQPITRGPWDHRTQHGGPPCGILGHVTEREMVSSGLVLARLSVELLTPVPVGDFEITAEVVRKGRRAAVVDAHMRHEGRLVARAHSQWLRPTSGTADAQSQVSPTDPPVPPRGPDVLDPTASGALADVDGYPRPGFNCDAIEIRLVSGSTEVSGPGCVWFRLRSPVVDGAPVTPLTRFAALSDLGAAAGWETSPSGRGLINSDVTMQLVRPPRGEWLCFDSRTRSSSAGVGFCDSLVFDDDGVVGRVVQSLVEVDAPW